MLDLQPVSKILRNSKFKLKKNKVALAVGVLEMVFAISGLIVAVTSDLALTRLLCQSYGGIGSGLGLVGPAFVHRITQSKLDLRDDR